MSENPSHGGTVAEIGDLIIGDIPISEFLFGTPAKRRLIPHLRGELPIFELNGKSAVRLSRLAAAIAERERAASPSSEASLK